MSLSTDARNMQYSFGPLLRELRTQRSWSLRDLSERINFSRGYIGKVEQGERFPELQFAQLADRALTATGDLIEAWAIENDQRRDLERAGRILTASVADSLRLIASAEDRLNVDEINKSARGLAVEYLATPPEPMLISAVELRSEIFQRLQTHHYRPNELADLYLSLGRLQGVLAYAALDLGDPEAAETHARAAMTCAEQINDNELRAWVRGTESLIARFSGDYTRAQQFIEDGLRYPAAGTGRLRLLSGLAQCRANLGDSESANTALNRAQRERDALTTADSAGGLFEFSEAKQHYYAGSSLIWLAGGKDADRAAVEANEAIAMWENEAPERRSLDDEALAHVYEATAHLQRGDLDQAEAAIRPILDLPANRQISWIRKRMNRFSNMLRMEPYQRSIAARNLHDEIVSLSA